MRYLLGVPIPETVEDLRALSPQHYVGPIKQLNPAMRRQVVLTVRKELESFEVLASRRGAAVAQREICHRLSVLGIKLPPGGESEVFKLAVPLLRAIATIQV